MTEEKKEKTSQKDEEKKEEQKEETPEKEIDKENPSVKKENTTKEEKEEVPQKFDELVKKIENLSVLELSELVKVLEKRFGVSAAAPVSVAPAAGVAGSDQGEEGGEKSEYNIEVKEAGEKKIEVIKAVRSITGKGLKEAKDLVDAVADGPQVIKEGVPAKEAKEAEKTLKEAGAVVELK